MKKSKQKRLSKKRIKASIKKWKRILGLLKSIQANYVVLKNTASRFFI